MNTYPLAIHPQFFTVDSPIRRLARYAVEHTDPSEATLIRRPTTTISRKLHNDRILDDLRRLGASWFGISTSEALYLPKIIHVDEPVGGVVYGKHEDGFVMMVATDRRVVFLDKKPLFVNTDEITYDVISGVKYSASGLGCSVILHTRVHDYKIRTFNHRCAKGFVEYIEARCLEQRLQYANMQP